MKNFVRMFAAMVLTGLMLAGCGAEKAPANTEAETAVTEAETAGETTEASATEESGTVEDAADASAAETEDMTKEMPETLTPDPTNLSYLEEYQIADYYGDGKEYPLYAPIGGENTDGFYYFWDHGVTFTASVFNCGDPDVAAEALQMYLQQTIDQQAKDWKENSDYSEVGVGEILEKGDDRYLFMTAMAKDLYGTPYQRTKLIYMSVREGGAGVFWDMEVSEREQDEDTMPLVNEVARCYGLNLGELAMEDGEWADQDAQREADQQDVYEPEEGEPVLEKVEGYQYLGMMDMSFCLDEEGFTCPILAPMGWNTSAGEDRVSTTIHGVYVRVSGDYTSASKNYQGMVQEGADRDFKYRSDPEEENRNVRVSELIPMQGQEAGVYYVVEYEEKERNSDEYHKRADVSFCIQVKEHYFIFGNIYLKSVDYDSKTNELIRELETAYGLDLSEWYADE